MGDFTHAGSPNPVGILAPAAARTHPSLGTTGYVTADGGEGMPRNGSAGALSGGGGIQESAAALQRGRRAFERQGWGDAYVQLAAADAASPLAAEDLERLATAAYLTGRDADSADAWTRAHQEFLRDNDVERAARSAFWLAFGLLNQGEQARAGGWLARARRLLGDGKRDCVEQGYLLFPTAVQRIYQGDNEGALAACDEAVGIGERFGDPDLTALARHGQGRALLRMGATDEGVALLDEAMAAVEAGDVSALAAGDIYCSVIEGCHEIYDLRRAQAWTAALSRWCESQPDLVPYRGQCLVRRAEILQLHGDWPEAAGEVQRACEWLLRPPPQRAVGAAFYQRAELHRLRGEFAKAEEAYRQAAQWGRRPEPGLILLRLAQGQTVAAQTAIRRLADETSARRARSALLPAYVEVMLAAGDVAAARGAADELNGIAGEVDAPLLHAHAGHSHGAVLLAEGQAQAALAVLRQAWSGWRELEAPYEAARARVLIGLCCHETGEVEAAAMELDAARCAFQQLGAATDVARVDALSSRDSSGPAHGLTPRELQVLRRVASGQTNRAIGRELFISEKTVDRHVSNIFIKLGVSSRVAATAFAYEHQLV
jgi:DNA-binding CsgD family transcriptional regulator